MDAGVTQWVALGAAVVATAVIAYAGWRTWRTWKAFRVTQEAASALIDVHYTRLDEAIATAGEHAGQFADRGEELADALAELRADAMHLRWMLARIPEERERLERELLEIILPTRERAKDAAKATTDA
jgi:hypothetical protein